MFRSLRLLFIATNQRCEYYLCRNLKSVPLRRFFRILVSSRLWINIGLIVLFIVLLVTGTLIWLNDFTRHGETVEVPDLSGFSVDELHELLDEMYLTYEITDSIYSDDQARGTVVQQNPLPGKEVKRSRTLYLTVNSILPEAVMMPDLTGKSRRIAIPMLQISGLEIEQLTYKPDESCTDCVIDQLFEGKTIDPGTQIRKGAAITLVLGQRSDEETQVPRLLGLSYEDAQSLLNAYSLNMGTVLACEGCQNADDSAAAYVVNQLPAAHEDAGLGSFVDLYLSTDSAKAAAFFDNYSDTTTVHTTPPNDDFPEE